MQFDVIFRVIGPSD